MLHDILIFTDGSSRGNPGPGGWGAIIGHRVEGKGLSEERVEEIGGQEENTTNNRMELRAAIEGLKFAFTLNPKPSTLNIFTDSTYLIKGITEWIHGWKRNGWKTAVKQDVENRDLWEILDGLVVDKKIEWLKVKGHSGHSANERCDEIATAFADLPANSPEVDGRLEPKLYRGSLSGYKISLETKMPAKKEILYISLVEGEENFDKTWEECERRVKGKTGARFKKVRSREEGRLVLDDWKFE